MIRLIDLAKQAGVSAMTVSKALRDAPDVSAATKARLKALAQQLGYVPNPTAQGLRTRTTKVFGLVISSLTNPIFSRVVLALEERAFDMGYDLLLTYTFNNPDREEAGIRRLLSRRVDGLFISPVYRMSTEAPVYKEISARGTPTVIMGHLAPFCSQFINVETDDLQAGYEVTHHLLELGHKRIAFLAGPPGTPWTQERFEGYRRALRQAKMDVDDKLVFQAGRTIEEGAAAAAQMMAEGVDATAVQGINDLVAVGCAHTFLRAGIQIPREMSITGFGNTLISEYFRPGLTTVSQPKHRLGAAAMDAMQGLLRHARVEPRRLPANLVVRESTGTAPATPVLKRLKLAQSK